MSENVKKLKLGLLRYFRFKKTFKNLGSLKLLLQPCFLSEVPIINIIADLLQ